MRSPLEFNFRVVPEESLLEDWSSFIQYTQGNYDYGLELLDSDGKRLVIVPLYSSTLAGVPPRGYLDLSAPIPDPAEHASYRLLRGSDVVDGVPSTQAPLVVEILEPSAGAVIDSSNASIELVWQLCEEPADQDGLVGLDMSRWMTVEYSLDGGNTYHRYISDRRGDSYSEPGVWRYFDGRVHRFKVRLIGRSAAFGGGAEQARFRLVVTHGSRWAVAESPVFNVEPSTAEPPVLTIWEPDPGDTLENPGLIELKAELNGFEHLADLQDPPRQSSATADDREPAPAGRALVTWLDGRGRQLATEAAGFDSSDGSLYNGVYTWRLDTSQLLRGPNTLTAAAFGNAALKATDSVEIVVAPDDAPTVADDAPTAIADDTGWQLTPFAREHEAAGVAPDADAPLTIHVLRNDIMGKHGLDPETLRIVRQPRVGSAEVALPPEALDHLHRGTARLLLDALRASAGEPEWTPQQQWDDELSSARSTREVIELYKTHSVIVYTAESYNGERIVNDRLTYEICDTQPQPACSQADVRILLRPPGQFGH